MVRVRDLVDDSVRNGRGIQRLHASALATRSLFVRSVCASRDRMYGEPKDRSGADRVSGRLGESETRNRISRIMTELLDLAWQEPLVSVDEAATILATAEKYLQDPFIDKNSGLLLAIIHRLARTIIRSGKTEPAPEIKS